MRIVLTWFLVLLAACTAGPEPPRAPTTTHDATVGAVERVVIDTRPPEQFAEGHLPGALNLQLGWDQLGARVRSYVPNKSDGITLRGEDEAADREAYAILTELGYEDVVVFEPPAERERSTLELWDTERLAAALESDSPPVVIDVRSRSAHETQTIPGALLFEQDEAPGRIDELDRDGRYVVICEAGWRSSQLASYLRRQGFRNVVNVIDGMAGWRAR